MKIVRAFWWLARNVAREMRDWRLTGSAVLAGAALRLLLGWLGL